MHRSRPRSEGADPELAQAIDDYIEEWRYRLVAIRHEIHRHPELSREESRTTTAVANALSDLDLRIRRGPSDLGLIIDQGPPGPRVALRADLDALAIHEESGVPFASKNKGVMHACGHDVHTAILIGAVRALHRTVPDRPLRFIFQPAEEATPGGAIDMVEAGAMDDVIAIMALHVDPHRPVGNVGIQTGPLTSACDVFRLRIHGHGGHGARPHETQDTILIAAQAIQAMHHAFDRGLDARHPFVLTFGTLHAGATAHNVIPAVAEMTGTVRTPIQVARDSIEPLMRKVLGGLCGAWGLEYELELKQGAPPVVNDASVVDVIRHAATQVVGSDRVTPTGLPSMGAEDFSWYLPYAPGAMFRLGVGIGSPLHSATFRADDAAIPIGARILAHAALDRAYDRK